MQKDSFMHSLHPNFKFFSIIILSASAGNAEQFIQLIPFSISLIMILFFSKISIHEIFQALTKMLTLLIFVFAINIYGTSDIIFSSFTACKLLIIIFFSLMLTYTTSPEDCAVSIGMLISPLKIFKINTTELTNGCLTAMASIPLFFEEIKNASESAKGLPFLKRYTSSTSLFIDNFFEKAFKMKIEEYSQKEVKKTVQDVIFLSTTILFAGVGFAL